MSETAHVHAGGPGNGADLTDLLIERALWGLGERDESRVRAEMGMAQAGAFDRAVGAVAVAMNSPEELPDSLRRSLEAAGRAFFAARAEDENGDRSGVHGPADGPASIRMRAGAAGRRARPGPAVWAGWAAAAACLVFAWVFTRPDPVLTAADRMTRLENTASDLVRTGWLGLTAIGAPSSHPLDAGVEGELVWSDLRDEGYMRISGVRPNDPGEFQYQLWIFDATRPRGQLPQFKADGLPEILTQRPVSGGVFDIPRSGEVVIPVDPQLPIGEGVIFAVTKEPPGGVVQSDRDIVFLALKG